MSVRPIVTYPEPVLLTPAKPVTGGEFGPDLARLADDMAETMYAANGIGLAAPQIAVGRRVMVIDVEWPEREDSTLWVLANPEVVEARGEVIFEEGCLSFPELTVPVERSAEVRVRARDAYGQPVEFEADGILAICVQHELDHLDGVTMLDRATGEHRARLIAEMKTKPWYRPELLPEADR